MKKTVSIFAILLLAFFYTIHAEAGDQNRGRWLYERYCEDCHGNDGSGTPYGRDLNFPVKDLRPNYLLTTDEIKLVIKYGLFERELLDKGKGFTDEDIDDIISYIRTFAYTPSPGKGRRLYRRLCAFCHGRDGEGDRNFLTPNLKESSITDIDMARLMRQGRHDTKMIDKKQRLKNTEIADICSYLLSIRTAGH